MLKPIVAEHHLCQKRTVEEVHLALADLRVYRALHQLSVARHRHTVAKCRLLLTHFRLAVEGLQIYVETVQVLRTLFNR